MSDVKAIAGSIVLGIAAAGALMPAEDRAGLFTLAADRLAPPDRSAPSVWAERRVELTAEQTARPGRFSADVLPFQREAMDAHWRESDRLGVIAPKCAQIGWTLLDLIDMCYGQASDPGPELEIACDDLKAKEYCFDRFVPLVKGSGEIARVVEEAGSDKKIIGYGVHFPGGKVTFGWATSEKRVVGTPFKRARIDDAEASFDAYPSKAGDLFTSVETRTETYRGVRKITVNGHPRLEDGGIWALYLAKSDMRVWTIDCPHCSGPVGMRWRNVHYRGRDESGRPRPETAELRCPHGGCGRAITDAQRARALWMSPERRARLYPELPPLLFGQHGSGRYESELDPEEARRRPYIGLHTTRLCDPGVSVVELARKLADCGEDQAKILDVLNKVIGEPYSHRGAATLSDDHLDGLLVREAFGAEVKTVPADVEFLVVGGDVQQGPTGPKGPVGLYLCAIAYARSGMAYVVDARTLVGFDALHGLYLPSMRVRTADGRELPVSWCGLDAAYATSATLEACRAVVYTAVGGPYAGSRVNLAALRYDPRGVDSARTIAEAPEKKRLHPTRPELGYVEYWYAHRHSWVARTHARLTEKRLAMLCPEPPAWREHMNANFLAPLKKQHDWETARLEWTKARQVRDDYARAIDYAEIVASIKCGLDGIHLLGQEAGRVQGFTFGGRSESRADEWDG